MNGRRVSVNELDTIASDSWYCRSVNAATIRYSYEIFARHIGCSGRILELGPAEGVMTELLHKRGGELTVVEGSSVFAERLRERYPDVEVVHSLFEEFETDKTFSCIVLGHVLEHVDSPVEILSHVKRFLAPGGSFLAAVPNANSLHRQAAVLMGLIPEIKHFSEKDIHHGHKRVYTAKELKADFVNAGLAVKVLGGYWLKPLSDGQIEASWTDGMVAAFMRLGEAYPEIAGEIYIVAGI